MILHYNQTLKANRRMWGVCSCMCVYAHPRFRVRLTINKQLILVVMLHSKMYSYIKRGNLVKLRSGNSSIFMSVLRSALCVCVCVCVCVGVDMWRAGVGRIHLPTFHVVPREWPQKAPGHIHMSVQVGLRKQDNVRTLPTWEEGWKSDGCDAQCSFQQLDSGGQIVQSNSHTWNSARHRGVSKCCMSDTTCKSCRLFPS